MRPDGCAILCRTAGPSPCVHPLQPRGFRLGDGQLEAGIHGNAGSADVGLTAAAHRGDPHGSAWFDVAVWRAFRGRNPARVRVSLLRVHDAPGLFHLLPPLLPPARRAPALEMVHPGTRLTWLAGKCHSVQDCHPADANQEGRKHGNQRPHRDRWAGQQSDCSEDAFRALQDTGCPRYADSTHEILQDCRGLVRKLNPSGELRTIWRVAGTEWRRFQNLSALELRRSAGRVLFSVLSLFSEHTSWTSTIHVHRFVFYSNGKLSNLQSTATTTTSSSRWIPLVSTCAFCLRKLLLLFCRSLSFRLRAQVPSYRRTNLIYMMKLSNRPFPDVVCFPLWAEIWLKKSSPPPPHGSEISLFLCTS